MQEVIKLKMQISVAILQRMKNGEKELKKRDGKRGLDAELLESVRQMKAGRAGKIHKVTEPPLFPRA